MHSTIFLKVSIVLGNGTKIKQQRIKKKSAKQFKKKSSKFEFHLKTSNAISVSSIHGNFYKRVYFSLIIIIKKALYPYIVILPPLLVQP